MATKSFQFSLAEGSLNVETLSLAVTHTHTFDQTLSVIGMAGTNLTAFGQITTVKLLIVSTTEPIEVKMPHTAAAKCLDLDNYLIVFGHVASIGFQNARADPALIRVRAYGD